MDDPGLLHKQIDFIHFRCHPSAGALFWSRILTPPHTHTHTHMCMHMCACTHTSHYQTPEMVFLWQLLYCSCHYTKSALEIHYNEKGCLLAWVQGKLSMPYVLTHPCYWLGPYYITRIIQIVEFG